MTSRAQTSAAQGPARAPDFFLIGVPRAATTSLYLALRQHPLLFMPQLKEAFYTCREFDAGLRRTQTHPVEQTERPPLDQALRDRLREEFQPEVERLSVLGGIDLRARWWPES